MSINLILLFAAALPLTVFFEETICEAIALFKSRKALPNKVAAKPEMLEFSPIPKDCIDLRKPDANKIFANDPLWQELSQLEAEERSRHVNYVAFPSRKKNQLDA